MPPQPQVLHPNAQPAQRMANGNMILAAPINHSMDMAAVGQNVNVNRPAGMPVSVPPANTQPVTAPALPKLVEPKKPPSQWDVEEGYNREYLIVHGFVFTRVRPKEDPLSTFSPAPSFLQKPKLLSSDATPPKPILQKELFSLLKYLGPKTCEQWPFFQIPMNPDDAFGICAEPKSPGTSRRDRAKSLFKTYLLSPVRFNPTAYINVYEKAPYPPILQAIASATFASRLTDVDITMQLDHTVCRGMTRIMSEDLRFANSRRFHMLFSAKEFISKMERSLHKACLLMETWGLNGCALNKWMSRLKDARSTAQLARLAVKLVDAADTRSFYEE